MYQLFEPAELGPMSLKNRTVRSATNEHLSTPDGQFTGEWADTAEELARGGVGLIITGHMTVDRAQRADAGQPVMDGGAEASILERAVRAVHSQGAKIVMQLSHPGLKAPEQVNGRPAKGPGDFTGEELDALADRFVRAAELAKRAGFDGVQIHNAHGYLLSSFINPETNTRADAYGGPMENRFRLTGRIICRVREACGADFAILAKADCNSTGDFPALAKLYEQAGTDALEVSGLDFSSRAGEKKAFYLDQALAAQKQVEMPIILVGGIFSRSEAGRVLQSGIPFVSFCRALICQANFIRRMEQGEEESRCLQCNGCYKVYRVRPVRCVRHSTPIAQLEKNLLINLK